MNQTPFQLLFRVMSSTLVLIGVGTLEWLLWSFLPWQIGTGLHAIGLIAAGMVLYE